MEVKKVGVVGCGLMGSGIAQVAAQCGYQVKVREVTPELLQKGLDGIKKFMSGAVAKGKMAQWDMDKVLANLSGTTQLTDLADCDLVVEAVTENFAVKKEVFETLDKACQPNTIIGSNTSSLSITEMAAVTKRPDKIFGVHFFNPVPIMKLVEVVKALTTSEETFLTTKAWAESMGKTVVACSDTTGFVVNRLLVPYLLDAIRALEAGIASREDIDNAMKLGCGYPMGPLTLLDFVGLETTLYIADIMFNDFKLPQYAAPSLLRRMVLAGHVGKKSGKGFYDYSGK
jgi:3-hydroxybutyryl-CoA dehydrogenase